MGNGVINDPGVLLFGCVVWIPIGAWVLHLIHWMVMGDVDFVEGIIGLSIGIGLGVASLVPETRAMNGFFFAAALGTIAFFPIVRRAIDRRELNALDLDQFEKAYQAVALKPDNIGARFKVASIAYDRGYAGHAVRLTERYIPNMDKRAFWEEHRLYQRWVGGGIPPEAFEPLKCLDCGTETAPDLLHCPKCGSPVLLEYVKGKAVNRAVGRKLIVAWMAMVVVLAGLPVASQLPTAAGLLLVAALLGLLGVAFWLTFRESARRPA